MSVLSVHCPNCTPTVRIELLVLDEADRLLDDQFVGQIDNIITLCDNPQLSKAMFSATMPKGTPFPPCPASANGIAVVEELAQTTLKNPINVTVGTKYVSQGLGSFVFPTPSPCAPFAAVIEIA